MKRWILPAVLTLTACGQSAGEEAEKQYDIVARNEAGYSARCSAATRAKQAWLEERNETKYQLWQATAFADCSKAERGAID